MVKFLKNSSTMILAGWGGGEGDKKYTELFPGASSTAVVSRLRRALQLFSNIWYALTNVNDFPYTRSLIHIPYMCF